jgi:hypothetical protein
MEKHRLFSFVYVFAFGLNQILFRQNPRLMQSSPSMKPPLPSSPQCPVRCSSENTIGALPDMSHQLRHVYGKALPREKRDEIKVRTWAG